MRLAFCNAPDVRALLDIGSEAKSFVLAFFRGLLIG